MLTIARVARVAKGGGASQVAAKRNPEEAERKIRASQRTKKRNHRPRARLAVLKRVQSRQSQVVGRLLARCHSGWTTGVSIISQTLREDNI